MNFILKIFFNLLKNILVGIHELQLKLISRVHAKYYGSKKESS